MLQNFEGLGSLWDDRSVDYTSKRPALEPQFAWFEMQASILEFHEELPSGAYFHLRDEDVLTRPKEVLELLCAWITHLRKHPPWMTLCLGSQKRQPCRGSQDSGTPTRALKRLSKDGQAPGRSFKSFEKKWKRRASAGKGVCWWH
jgi:hypothetical protein